MTYFVRHLNNFHLQKFPAADITEKLPPGYYAVRCAGPGQPLHLEIQPDFKPLSRVYGSTLKDANRILQTFLDRDDRSTGALFSGPKGSGKTLLSRTICIEAVERLKFPVIIIDLPWSGPTFNDLLKAINQPCVFFFDEFEKMYKDRSPELGNDASAQTGPQEDLLSIFDGLSQFPKLFLLTVNNVYGVSEFMKNRPGRVYYNLRFTSLEDDFIREFCQENLENKSHTEAVVSVASLFWEFSFDMLNAMVEEMNRYGESPSQVLRVLNLKPESDYPATYNIKMYDRAGKLMPVMNPHFNGVPLKQEVINVMYAAIPVTIPETDTPEYFDALDQVRGKDRRVMSFTQEDFSRLENRTFIFENKHGCRLELTRVVDTPSSSVDRLF